MYYEDNDGHIYDDLNDLDFLMKTGGIRATELKLWTVREKKVLDALAMELAEVPELPKEQLLLYTVIRENPLIRKPKIAEISSLSESSVKNALKTLKSKGYIEYIGLSRTGGYKVK